MHGVYLAAGEPREKIERPSIWHHLLSWLPLRSKPNMLFLFYEDLVQVRPPEWHRFHGFSIGAVSHQPEPQNMKSPM